MIIGFVRCNSSSELWRRLNKGTPSIRCFLACCRRFVAGKTRATLQTGNPPPLVSFTAKKIWHQLCLTTPLCLWDYFLCSSSKKILIVPIKGFPLNPPNTPIRALGMSSWQFSIHPFVVVCELYLGNAETSFVLLMSPHSITSFRLVDGSSHFLLPPVCPLFFSTVFWDRLLICSRWGRRTWDTEIDRESSEDHCWQLRSNVLIQLQSFYMSALFATHLLLSQWIKAVSATQGRMNATISHLYSWFPDSQQSSHFLPILASKLLVI